MQQPAEKQRTLTLAVYPDLRRWVDGFFVAKRAKGAAPRTLAFYREKLGAFVSHCQGRNVTVIEAIDAGLIREFLVQLSDQGHNPGGVHAYYRTVRTFLLWYEREAEPDGWRNPIRRVEAPKVAETVLEPVELPTVGELVRACGPDLYGLRDRAILLTLLDTGARASELVAFDLPDLDPATGTLTIRRAKGGKVRAAFLGHKARRAVRAYLRARGDLAGPLFAAKGGGRLSYFGLRSMVVRGAREAGVSPAPSLHSFRRAFTLDLLRSGADLLSIQRLLGHADMSLLKRYARQNVDDLRAVHAQYSPVDRAGWS
jgi:site-specific recombinase XerD